MGKKGRSMGVGGLWVLGSSKGECVNQGEIIKKREREREIYLV